MCDSYEGYDQGTEIQHTALHYTPAPDHELARLLDRLFEKGVDADADIERFITYVLCRVADFWSLTRAEVQQVIQALLSTPQWHIPTVLSRVNQRSRP